MMSPSADKDAEITEAFNSTSRYLEDLIVNVRPLSVCLLLTVQFI